MTEPTRDIEADIDRAMSDCWKCRNLTEFQREEHKSNVMRQILTKQTIPPHVFPDTVWQHGRPDTRFAINKRRDRA